MVTDLVEIIESRVVTTSARVADYFGKEHKHVLDSIKALEKDMGVLGTEPKFRLSEYCRYYRAKVANVPHGQGRLYAPGDGFHG